MATLLRSVTKLLRHAKKKLEKNDPTSYSLEMHIFFDNVFEKRDIDKDGKDDFINANCWTELNQWVVQFQPGLQLLLSELSLFKFSICMNLVYEFMVRLNFTLLHNRKN